MKRGHVITGVTSGLKNIQTMLVNITFHIKQGLISAVAQLQFFYTGAKWMLDAIDIYPFF